MPAAGYANEGMHVSSSWFALPLVAAILLLIAVTALTVYIHRLNLRLKSSEERHRVIYEHAPLAFMVSDKQFRVTGWNVYAEKTFGWTREEMLGTEFFPRLVPDDQVEHCQRIAQELSGSREAVFSRNWNLTRDGRRILCDWMNAKLHDASGRLIGYASAAVDVTPQHLAEESLRESEQRFRLLAENAIEVISTVDLDGRVTYVSPAITRVRGFTPEEVVGHHIEDLLTEESGAIAREALAELHASGKLPQSQYRVQQPHKDGGTIWADVTVNTLQNDDGEVTGFLTVTRDATKQQAQEAELRHLAHHDALTELPNRSLFFDRLNMALARSARDKAKTGLLYVDLDGFKQINDERGHHAGDVVLKTIAERLRKSIRESDTAARIGGDEFAIVLTTMRHEDDAYHVAEKIVDAFAEPIALSDEDQVIIGGSIGIALYPDDAMHAEELLKLADHAMYKVKRTGKGDYRRAKPSRLN